MMALMKHVIFIILIFLIKVLPQLSAQNIFYVSPFGNNNAKGTLEDPFGNIEEAQKKAREVKTGETIIFLRGGEYRLSTPLLFTIADGNDSKSIYLRSFSNEKVVINGSEQLNLKWTPYQNGILKAKVDSNIDIDILLVNGEIRTLARYPNYDSTAIRFNGTSAEATAPQRVKKWKDPVGGYLHVMHEADWGDFHYRIMGKDSDGNLFLEGGWQNNRPYGLSQQNRMVENIFEELDYPGEWYYNKEKSILYYYPLPNENVNLCTFEVPLLKHLIEFRGTMENPVKNIHIDGLEFTGTKRTFMEKYEPLLRSDWTIYRGAAIFFEGTENCSLKNCFIHHLGGNGVFFSKYNRNSFVASSFFTQIGASAICFVGDSGAVRSPSFTYEEFVPINEMDRTIGPKTNNYPYSCMAYDNLINQIGIFEKQVAGVQLSMCQYITVSHNSIYDTPRAGINISDGTWGGHIIEYNDVFDNVKETGDHGSFNSWGRDRFWHPDRKMMDSIAHSNTDLLLADAVATTIIRYNRFRCDRGWDIDLDDGSSNYHIYGNLCLNGGIKLREGFYRMVENNILVNNTFHPHVWFNNCGDIFTRNIVMTPYLPINLKSWGTQVDYNIFTDSIAYASIIHGRTDKHSIVHPVNFSNTSCGDYKVKSVDTPVFLLGFKNFDMDNFGVVSSNLKRIAKTPKFSVPLINKEIINTEIVVWNGIRIKNLETLGERSATGMDSERGVYVISVIDPYSSLKDYFQANDVILELADHSINNLDDLKDVLRQIDSNKIYKFVVFRNQKKITFTISGVLLYNSEITK